MAKRWFYTNSGKQCGPTSSEELMRLAKEGSVKPTDYIWTDGMKD